MTQFWHAGELLLSLWHLHDLSTLTLPSGPSLFRIFVASVAVRAVVHGGKMVDQMTVYGPVHTMELPFAIVL